MNESARKTMVAVAVVVVLAVTSAAVWLAASRDLSKVSVTTQETSETTENGSTDDSDSDTDNDDTVDTDADDESSDGNDDDEPTEEVDWSFLNSTASKDSGSEATDAGTTTAPPQRDPGPPPASDEGPRVMVDPVPDEYVPADGEERVDPPAVQRPSDADDLVIDEDDEPQLRRAPGYEDGGIDEILPAEDAETETPAEPETEAPATAELAPGGIVVEWEPPLLQIEVEPEPEPTVHVIIPDAADLIDSGSICVVVDWC